LRPTLPGNVYCQNSFSPDSSLSTPLHSGKSWLVVYFLKSPEVADSRHSSPLLNPHGKSSRTPACASMRRQFEILRRRRTAVRALRTPDERGVPTIDRRMPRAARLWTHCTNLSLQPASPNTPRQQKPKSTCCALRSRGEPTVPSHAQPGCCLLRGTHLEVEVDAGGHLRVGFPADGCIAERRSGCTHTPPHHRQPSIVWS
jgi:hypothetical protein